MDVESVDVTNYSGRYYILVSDMGFPLERVVTFQSTGALGYGIEYAYSIQERQRLAALGGDKMMGMPERLEIMAYSSVEEALSPSMPL